MSSGWVRSSHSIVRHQLSGTQTCGLEVWHADDALPHFWFKCSPVNQHTRELISARNTSFSRKSSKELRMYLWRSLCTWYLHACQVRVTVGYSGLCCTCLTSFERQLTPLFVNSVWAIWASLFPICGPVKQPAPTTSVGQAQAQTLNNYSSIIQCLWARAVVWQSVPLIIDDTKHVRGVILFFSIFFSKRRINDVLDYEMTSSI